jgi:two-component system sensor histidine kinase UhpB
VVLEDYMTFIDYTKKIKARGHGIFEIRFRKKDLSITELEVSASYNRANKTFFGFCVDINIRKDRQKKLSDALGHLEKLNHYKTKARENEQANLASEIQDVLGQPVTALRMDFDWLKKQLRNPEICAENLERMIQQADQIIQNIQRITGDLRPGILDDLGLQSAIEWYASGFYLRTGIRADLDLDYDCVLPAYLQLAVYRVFQEAMVNVARHSNATEVKIYMEMIEDEFQMTITDNGCGIPEETIRSDESFGLIGMSERVMLIGGKFTIYPGIPSGTVVSIVIPGIGKDHRHKDQSLFPE